MEIKKNLIMKCIICDKENESQSIEHIVPESLGNKSYIMVKGSICDSCNRGFSTFEKKALGNSVLLMERARQGIPSKKGKTAKGEIKGLGIEGDENFIKNNILVTGLTPENLKNFDPSTETFELKVESFDNSQNATSKLLLKMGIESIFKSKNKIFKKMNFEELKQFLRNDNNQDWAFLTSKYNDAEFISIPKFDAKYQLKKINCEMKYKEIDESTLLFKFKYGEIEMVINLINRDLKWVDKYQKEDECSRLYPEHFRKKLKKRFG